MKTPDFKYDGSFVIEGNEIFYYFTENNYPIKNDKFSRYINFCTSTEILGAMAIYDSVDQMCNISPYDAEKWYIEGKAKGFVK